MDTKRLFMKMKDTSNDGYRMKQSLYLIGKSAVRYAVFPLVICAVLAGGGFTAADSVTVDGGNAVFESFKKSSILVGSPEDLTVEACGEITDDNDAETEKETDDGTYGGAEDEAEENNEELLQRLYDFDKSKVPDGYIGIVPVSLYRQPEEGCVYVSDAGNKKQLEAAPYLTAPLAVTYEESEEYQVLIIHTHGTESYSKDGAFCTEKGSYPRSSVKEENMVRIGDIFEDTFNEAGIKTIHCEIPIDKESYSKAYSNAAKIIKDYLKKYPTIKYMFDIHRDAVELSDGSKARLVTAANNEAAAQLMFVVGSDRLVSENKNWRDNLTFAVKLQYALDEEYPGLMRPINIKQGAFNQFYTPLSVLIEVGSDGNSMEEAERSAKILAEQMVKTIKEE